MALTMQRVCTGDNAYACRHRTGAAAADSARAQRRPLRALGRSFSARRRLYARQLAQLSSHQSGQLPSERLNKSEKLAQMITLTHTRCSRAQRSSTRRWPTISLRRATRRRRATLLSTTRPPIPSASSDAVDASASKCVQLVCTLTVRAVRVCAAPKIAISPSRPLPRAACVLSLSVVTHSAHILSPPRPPRR